MAKQAWNWKALWVLVIYLADKDQAGAFLGKDVVEIRGETAYTKA